MSGTWIKSRRARRTNESKSLSVSTKSGLRKIWSEPFTKSNWFCECWRAIREQIPLILEASFCTVFICKSWLWTKCRQVVLYVGRRISQGTNLICDGGGVIVIVIVHEFGSWTCCNDVVLTVLAPCLCFSVATSSFTIPRRLISFFPRARCFIWLAMFEAKQRIPWNQPRTGYAPLRSRSRCDASSSPSACNASRD